MSWDVYIARCKDKTLYVGVSSDTFERIARHNKGEGSRWVRQHGPARLIYKETYQTHKEARRRETQIKKWSRAKKENLINGTLKRE